MESLVVGKAEYDGYLLNGQLAQLRRLDLGADIEEAHMRNRQLNVHWAIEKGKEHNVIERISENGKTYFKINDYEMLRELFGGRAKIFHAHKRGGIVEGMKNKILLFQMAF